MTTEEKAKAYDEALKWMRELYPGLHGTTKEDAEHYFPELRESEDERIRKWIISQMQTFHKQANTEGSWEDFKMTEAAIAWLEKHKEQKPAECRCTNDESEYDKGYREGHRFGLKQTQEYMLSGGKIFSGLIPCWVNAPSEFQPAHKYHGKNVVVMHENNGGFRCICIDDEKPVTFHLPEDTLFAEGWRKNPDWSEEDEKMLKWLCRIIHSRVVNKELSLAEESELGKWIDKWINHEPQHEKKWSEFDEDCLKRAVWYIENPAPQVVKDTNLVLWLKSLRPQPKKELSIEKAIQWLDDTFYFLDNSSGRGRDCEITTHDFDSLEEMYDSFRKAVTVDSQPSWKPSEEQMDSLRDTIVKTKGYSYSMYLPELYEQLKKLGVKEDPEYYQHFDPDC